MVSTGLQNFLKGGVVMVGSYPPIPTLLDPSAVDAPALPDLLAELEQVWRQVDLPLVHRLRPGLSEDHVRTRLAEHGLSAPDEVIQWFGWHDGYEALRAHDFAPVGELITLDAGLALYREPITFGERGIPLYDSGWLAVVHWSFAAHMVLDCTHTGQHATTASLSFPEPGEVVPPPDRHPSLTVPVAWWLERWRTGAWYPANNAVCHDEELPCLVPGDSACGIY